jgi:hypothetical protein
MRHSEHNTIRDFIETLRGVLRFDTPQLAFCTHFSWFGVVKKERLGIEETHLFYNRRRALLSPNLLTFRIRYGESCGCDGQRRRSNLPLAIEEHDGRGFSGKIAFLEPDILCYHAKLEEGTDASIVWATFLLPETNPKFRRSVSYDPVIRLLVIHTSAPATDNRDPDPHHALTICLQIPEAFTIAGIIADGEGVEIAKGGLDLETDGSLVLNFTAQASELAGHERTFIVGIGEGPTADRIESRMPRGKHVDSQATEAASMRWLTGALDKFTFDGIPRKLRVHYAKAAYQIISNTKAPRGQIGRYSVFPSRGTYCAHYLWDACFTNLGVGQFNERLAEDYLVALCEAQEPDGKIPQFVCATWNRPAESQPPLIAWSAWRLYERFRNKELIRDVYEPLCRMVEWWFANRDEDGDGLVEYQHPLESGWDDSPRFDAGRIAAVDLNSYLNREMRILAQMAPVIARDAETSMWNRRAEEHAAMIRMRLFDPEDEVFYDRLVHEDRFHKVLTPASFMPLWTGIRLPVETVHRMVVRYLLNPKHFFGSKPFPVVAYSDRHYMPDKWWRGPLWPNIAWIMTEILRVQGFHRDYSTAVKRLVDIMTKHDELNELYSSATGRPLGAEGLCWGCAVFMDLARKLGGAEE